jgi:hypothetical protein
MKYKITSDNGSVIVPLKETEFTIILKLLQWINDPENVKFGELRIIKENKYFQITPSLTYRIDRAEE